MTRVNARNPALFICAGLADNECRPMQIGLIEFQSVRARARAPLRGRLSDFLEQIFARGFLRLLTRPHESP